VGAKYPPVAIGRLERFVADAAMGRGWDEPVRSRRPGGKRAAIVGSGPSGLACAGDLAQNGVAVTIFEALHVAGGVLKYGIPEFRLPDVIIDAEIDNLRSWAWRSGSTPSSASCSPSRNCSRTWATIRLRRHRRGIAQIHGHPRRGVQRRLLGQRIPDAREPDARLPQPIYDTPVGMGKRVAVVGAGNTAMDSARVALRMGAEQVTSSTAARAANRPRAPRNWSTPSRKASSSAG
jgi:glutamate synthase (NADPH) small chain